jgi:deferrochelatase/peroxidase EfeB
MPAGVHIKSQLNVRVSEEAHALIRHYCDTMHVTQAKVIEFVLRERARQDGLRIRDVMASYAR